MPSPLSNQVRSALQAGNKIEAIRLLREQTHLSLAEAKRAVESGLVPETSPSVTRPQGLPAEVAFALAEGKKIKAIRLLRQANGLSLKQAKTIVDDAVQATNQVLAAKQTGRSHGKAPRKSVSASFVVTLVIIGASVIWLLGRAS